MHWYHCHQKRFTNYQAAESSTVVKTFSCIFPLQRKIRLSKEKGSLTCVLLLFWCLQAWSHFICPSINGICSGPGRLTQDLYNQLAAASNVSYGLQQYSPFLVDLEDCQTVRNTFTAIQTQHCHRMRKDTKWVWVGLAIISVGSMLSILLWMLYIRRRNMRYKRARYGKGSYAWGKEGVSQLSQVKFWIFLMFLILVIC
jgi:ABC-type multidrug transport system permease subunit